MHGFSLGSTFLVNAEVDSMGGVVDVGVGVGTKPSPRRAAIEKAQAELRLEYDVREERRRELEFLEKGGDPLDFKFGHAASVSVQSTSHTDQHPDQNLTSEAKGSFALTASPHGDSVESSGRLGVTTAGEPNSADNFDGENEVPQSNRTSMRPGRSSITPSEHSSQLGSRNVKDSEDSPTFHTKKGQAYKRRNRSRTNRDGPRSNSADMTSRGGHGSSIPARHGMLSKPVASENHFEVESDGIHVMHSTTSRVSELAEGKLKLLNSKERLEEGQNPSLKADEVPAAIRTVEPAFVGGRDNIDTVDAGCPPPSGAENTGDKSVQPNENSKINGDDKYTPTDAVINNAPVMMKGLDSESSCTQTNVSVDGNGNINSDLCTNLKNVDKDGATREQTLPVGEKSISRDDKMVSEKHVTNAMENASSKEYQISINLQGNGFTEEDHSEADKGKPSQRDEAKGCPDIEGQEKHNDTELKPDTEPAQHDTCVPNMDSSCPVRPLDPASNKLNKNDISGPSPVSVSQPFTENQAKPLDKAQEDRILEEARMIEAKQKRIAELSIGLIPREYRHKCHWDLVLEEMAWLANDFAQERLWKMTAAAQICRRVAFTSRIRLEEQIKFSNQKSVAHTLAKAVMEFWQSAGLSAESADSSPRENCKHETLSGAHEMDKASPDVLQTPRTKQEHAVYGYAVRFLQSNCSAEPIVEVEMPGVAGVSCDIDIPETSWQDQFTEENLFYAVPPGAMEMYRKSIESCLEECERIGNNIQEEVDTSVHDAAAECGYEDNDYEEDEGENVYYLPGALDASKPSKKKRKNMKSYAARSYEYGGDFGYGHCAETRNGTPQSNLMGKRPANSLHVDPIPTKRMRTASRQRVVGPFGAGSAGVAPVLSRADASSGDTNSFQDDQSTLHGGSVFPRGSEVDSTMNFEKQCTFDSAELAKSKKKKKIKHQNASYDQRWQLDSSMQNEQKDLVRKRLDNHQLESNGNGGLFGHHAKKPKLAKHSLDNSFDNAAPMSGSVASPVASQMSNMSNQTKIIKFIGSRDKGKKGKGLKVSGQLGSGSPWTIVEDQALVVLVHDMGPNWELVSDAINSILQFKCIFRKPQECKERHIFLMDRPSGDGADSAEDSGSSQPYPSTLPGIPKGSARQLFRSLHAHVEEDNIRSRFEKIIRIEQQMHFRKKKNDNQDLKQIAPVHGSHVLSLSQVIPNNVNSGVLTPLDLCDTATSNQDPLSHGYQSPHAGGLALPNQSSIPPMHPPNGHNGSVQGLQGSPSMGIGSNVASPPAQFTGARDARYSVSRSGSLPMEEQQRLHQYNSMLPGRNVQASTLSSSGSLSGSDRGARMHPGGNGVNMMPGMNRAIPMARSGVQGVPSSSMLNSGSVLASNMNVHPGTASGHGNTMFRPRDTLHGVRSGQSSEHQRQIAEMQMQATQNNSSGVAPFGGLSSGFSNQTASSPLPSYPGHHQQQHTIPHQHPHVLSSPHPHLSTTNHAATSDQQNFIRIARERQMQQRLLQRQHQHQHHPASGSSMTHGQTPSQLSMSSPLQSSSQVPSPSSSQPVPLPSVTPSSPLTPVAPQPHQQQKNLQALARNAPSVPGGMINQGGKQRQRQAQQLQQQYQQSGRQHPQQRQQSQSQQAKLMKGIGRGNMVIHQNVPSDSSHLNGLSANTASQVAEKGDPALHLMQGQNLYSGSSLNTLPPSKPLASAPTSGYTQSQKSCVNTGPATSKPVQQISSQLESGNQGQVPGVPSPGATGSNQGPSAVPSRNHQQLQGHPAAKTVNQSQPTLQRTKQQNRQGNSDCLTKSVVDHSPVEHQSSSLGPPPGCVISASAVAVPSSASNILRNVHDPICESAVTSASSPSAPNNSEAVTNSIGNEPSSSVTQGLVQRQSSGNNFVPHGHETQWQQQESQLEPPPLQPILPQKQSLQQLEQPSQRVPQSQPQPQIHGGQNVGFTGTANSRLD